MSRIVVIDTETTWTDEVMSIGAVIADGRDFSVIDSRYYLIDPAFRRGGMYSGVLHMRGTFLYVIDPFEHRHHCLAYELLNIINVIFYI